MTAAWGEAVRLAGRAQEQQLLRQVVGGAAQGTPCTVLVHGEAGVGKTRLVTSVADRARASGHTVLWGRCLRFGAGSSPYHPFLSAFEGLLPELDPADAPDLSVLYGDDAGVDPPARALHVIDRAVARLAERGPVVLVVDDLQWADVSSLDALAYLIAGQRRQPVAVLVTYRDEGIPDGHVLHGWVADMLRLPGVVDLPLDRLGLEETAQQLTYLCGATPRAGLVADVWDRSGGNCYLTELLARDVDPAEESLPEDIPDALRRALLARWHSLSPPARRLAQVLAVAGRPVAPRVLAGVAEEVDAAGALEETTVGGVTSLDRSGRVWFRHPLLADVLYATLPEGQARTLHRAFVEVLLAEGLRGTRAHGDLALHYAGAEMHDEAFEHCLLAAAEARATAAFPEAAVLLRRAADLWAQVSEPLRSEHGSWPALLTEAAWLARTVGDLAGSIELLERAMVLTDPREEPLTAARALRLHAQVRWAAGLTTDQPVDAIQRAVEISAAAPDSDEHALALADLADAEWWRGERTQARRHAERAVAVARRAGEPRALTCALGTLSNTLVDDDRTAEELAREALRIALEVDPHECAALAAIALANVVESQGRFAEAAEVLIHAHRRGSGVTGLVALLGTAAAAALLPLGRIDEARSLLRDVLASRPRGIVGIQAREAALVVAVRQGDLAEAARHLERLRELAEDFEHHLGLHGPGARAEYLLAVGRPDEVLALLERTVEAHSRSEPKYGDTLLLWAARAAAALPRHRRNGTIERVVEARSRAPVPAFEGEDRDPGQRAVHALFDAEVARGRGGADAVECWRLAASLADAAGLRFVAADARLRLAEALLGAHDRRAAGQLLREAHAMSKEMGAWGLRDEVAAVAAAARIGLGSPSVPEQSRRNPHGLTPREVEVLAHLVAGRSYGEIAAALFISEKTVSVHVSNLLRKTGTTSRVEAAAWGRRSGAVAAP